MLDCLVQVRLVADREQFPGTGDAFELMFAPISEFNTRADDEILDCPRDQDFSRCRE